MFFNTFRFTSSVNNNCVHCAVIKQIGLVRNVVQTENSAVFLLYERFGQTESFFDYSCKSEDLGFSFKPTNQNSSLSQILSSIVILILPDCLHGS